MDHDRSLERTLERHALEMRRSAMRVRVGGALALAAVSLWLTWLHGQIASIDAQGVTTLVEARAQAEVPKAIDAVRQRLAEAAPQAIDHARQQMLDLPALARETLEAQADVWIAQNEAKLAQLVAEHVSFDAAALRSEIEDRYPDLDQRGQLEQLMRDFTRGYRQQVVALLAEPAFDCENLTIELERRILALARGRYLSDREVLQREILATLVALAPRLEAGALAGGAAFDVAALGR